MPAQMTLEIMRRLVHDMVLVTNDELKQAMAWLLEATHNLAEPAGAAATAAAWKLRDRLKRKNGCRDPVRGQLQPAVAGGDLRRLFLNRDS